MPIIDITFNNPLNTSVQVGDTAYFSNPLPVGSTNQWASTTTPHLTNEQQDIIKIGEIIGITQWDGIKSVIRCDMPQILFNKYFDDIEIKDCPDVFGCMDPVASNYNPIATVSDGSCFYPSGGACTDPTAINYNPNATISGFCCYPCGQPGVDNSVPGCCQGPWGALVGQAFNYDPLATCNDGSCVPYVYGCTDPNAFNYYAGANTDDGSCCLGMGCTDATACNYDATACLDDGSCEWTSC